MSGLQSMKKSIATTSTTDFEKVVKNVEQYKIELNILNAWWIKEYREGF